MTRLDEKAREWLGTPFHHQGRLPGVGLDCVGLVVCAATAVGHEVRDVVGYPRYPDGRSLVDALLRHADEVDAADMAPGDVLAIWIRDPAMPQHVAIASESGMIHTAMHVGKVVEQSISDHWRKRIAGVYRMRA